MQYYFRFNQKAAYLQWSRCHFFALFMSIFILCAAFQVLQFVFVFCFDISGHSNKTWPFFDFWFFWVAHKMLAKLISGELTTIEALEMAQERDPRIKKTTIFQNTDQVIKHLQNSFSFKITVLLHFIW
jgi:hypothetical protein